MRHVAVRHRLTDGAIVQLSLPESQSFLVLVVFYLVSTLTPLLLVHFSLYDDYTDFQSRPPRLAPNGPWEAAAPEFCKTASEVQCYYLPPQWKQYHCGSKDRSYAEFLVSSPIVAAARSAFYNLRCLWEISADETLHDSTVQFAGNIPLRRPRRANHRG